MPPRASKPPPTPAPVDETRKTADALWLFEQFLNCDPPVSLNVTPIAEKTGTKPNTIVKRINTFQHRYPGFGIVTRTTGAKQSSNVVPATPRVNAGSSVKKSVAKTAGRETRSKKVEAVEEDESDEEQEEKGVGKRDTTTKNRVARKGPVKKTKIDEEESHGQALTDDEDLDEPSDLPIRKVSKEIKSQKKDASKQLLLDSDDDVDHPEESDVEDEPPTKKIATPKTRGGRKSAGIGAIKDMHADPEKVVPRGRHAFPSRRHKAPDTNSTQDNIVEPSTEDVGKQSTHDPSNGTKRKRSETSERQSSPLTPSPAIKQRLDEIGSTEQSEEDGSHANQLESSDIIPPSKKQKTNPDPIEGDVAETETIVEKDCSLNTPEIQQAQAEVIADQEQASAKVERSQLDTMETSNGGPDAPAKSEQDFGESMTTPLNKNIDDVPSPSNGGDVGDDLAAQDAQMIDAPESPTAGRGQSVKLARHADISVTAEPTPKDAAGGSLTMRPNTVKGIELLPNSAGGDVEQGSITEASSSRKETVTTKSKAKEIGMRLMKAEASRPSTSSTEWLLYHPTTKPSKP